MKDGADAVTITTGGTAAVAVAVAGGDLTVGGNAIGITETAATGALTVKKGGLYLAQYSCAVTDASGSKLIQSLLLVGTTEQANSICESTSIANTPICHSGSAILSLNAGDLVKLAFTNNTDATNLIVDQVNFTLIGLDVGGKVSRS